MKRNHRINYKSNAICSVLIIQRHSLTFYIDFQIFRMKICQSEKNKRFKQLTVLIQKLNPSLCIIFASNKDINCKLCKKVFKDHVKFKRYVHTGLLAITVNAEQQIFAAKKYTYINRENKTVDEVNFLSDKASKVSILHCIES
ncbi:hypothetical protein T01_11364 [Trichinella spiralis]|uniref:Uncharacterized protein n=1 Tax=Trichinella spiralis TaxID=6334 RepID=A0A0V1BD48_TRISP|nr:hypothetical protein T01_11364 [Trichinella spiralis]